MRDFIVTNFSLLAPETKYRPLLTVRTTTRLTGVDFHTVDGETTAGSRAVHSTTQSDSISGGFFKRQRMQSSRSAKLARSKEARLTVNVSKNYKKEGRTRVAPRSQVPSQQSCHETRLGRVHVHPCCRLRPERLNPDPPTPGQTVCSPPKRRCGPSASW